MASTVHKNDKGMTFGLIFFASGEASHSGDKYRLVMESAKFADSHGFSSVWIPERHFTRDGWLYPNPAVLQAAIARETHQIALRAGSVVMPLHNPLRVAEEWAMVDNLSGGRVEISFASGWHPNDFALFPENYANRNEVMYRGIETVRKLWRGEAVQVKGGDGNLVELKTYPTPIQPELPIWVTAAGNPKTFAGAGEIGANLLTHMYNQSVDELAGKIRIYRESLTQHGYDPKAFKVSVMLHTFVGKTIESVREQVQGPFIHYLKSASYLLNAIAYSRGQKIDLSTLSEQDYNDYLNFVFERMITTQRVLFGTPETCLDLVKQLKAAGVDEIACQLDFGVDIDLALNSMEYLNQLKERADSELKTTVAPTWEVSHDGHQPGENHVNGSVPAKPVESVRTPQPMNLLEEIQSRCREEVAMPAFYERLSKRGIELSGSFQGIERLWRRDDEALGQIRLSAAVEQENDFYQVHPTLLDACLQVLIATLPDALLSRDDALYLPTGLGSFRMHRQPGKQVWSHAVLKTGTERADGNFEGDVRILDEHGQLLIEAQGLQLQRSEPVEPAASARKSTLPVVADGLADWLYELRWEPKAVQKSRHLPVERTGKWLIFMDSAGIGYRLAELLATQGATCFIVAPGSSYQVLGQRHYSINPEQPEDARRLVKSIVETDGVPLRGAVHLWSLDTASTEQISAATLDKDAVLGTGSALYLIQALIDGASVDETRFWLVTRGAQPVAAEEAALEVAQSPIWGLGRTCAMEHPELWGGLVDLDVKEAVEESAEQLLSVLADVSGEDQTAFRQGERFVARMVRSGNWTQQSLELRPDASYLITGGFWGLGFEVARWLALKGARHLVLMGRTQLPPRNEWHRVVAGSRQAQLIASIRELEQFGTRVYCATVDVTNEDALTAFLQEYYQQGHPAIKGVLHAASVWQDAQGQSLVRPLANLDATALQAVFSPKVKGSWLLHKLLQNRAIQKTAVDFFVSFSSGASLFGSAAQGNYAAAGTFLDVLAHYQRSQGIPALSIDWGAVSEIGFGATADGQRVHEYWESHGIQRITPRHVLAALELLIPQNAAQIGVIKLDWRLLQQFYPQVASLPLVTHLIAEIAGESTVAGAQEESAIISQMLGVEGTERQHLMEGYLSEQVANVLRVPAARLDIQQPLTALGLDSLMAIELKNRIELELKVRIPIVTFLQGPSIAQFATQVLDQVETMAAAQKADEVRGQNLQNDSKVAIMSQGEAEQLLTQLDQLSDAEVDLLLGKMLPEGNGKGNAHTGIDLQEAEALLAQLDQLSDERVDNLLNQFVQEEELNR